MAPGCELPCKIGQTSTDSPDTAHGHLCRRPHRGPDRCAIWDTLGPFLQGSRLPGRRGAADRCATGPGSNQPRKPGDTRQHPGRLERRTTARGKPGHVHGVYAKGGLLPCLFLERLRPRFAFGQSARVVRLTKGALRRRDQLVAEPDGEGVQRPPPDAFQRFRQSLPGNRQRIALAELDRVVFAEIRHYCLTLKVPSGSSGCW